MQPSPLYTTMGTREDHAHCKRHRSRSKRIVCPTSQVQAQVKDVGDGDNNNGDYGEGRSKDLDTASRFSQRGF